MKSTLCIGLLLMAAAGWAQEPAAPNTRTIIEVKYADVNHVADLLKPMFGGSTTIKADSSLHVIGVSGPPDIVAAVSAAIQKLDVPLSGELDVELTIYLISGVAQGQGTDDVPQELASTVKQLHGLFAYKIYKLSDALVLRGRSGRPYSGRETETEGVLPGTTNLTYHLAYNSLEVSPGDPRTVHINALEFSLRGPTVTTLDKTKNTSISQTQTPARIFTDLDVKEGQKTVVGKSSVNSAGDALILVIVPKIVE